MPSRLLSRSASRFSPYGCQPAGRRLVERCAPPGLESQPEGRLAPEELGEIAVAGLRVVLVNEAATACSSRAHAPASWPATAGCPAGFGRSGRTGLSHGSSHRPGYQCSAAGSRHEESRLAPGFPHAPRRTRISTGRMAHKAAALGKAPCAPPSAAFEDDAEKAKSSYEHGLFDAPERTRTSTGYSPTRPSTLSGGVHAPGWSSDLAC